MSISDLDFSGVSVVDNHAHALLRLQPADAPGFREHFSEARSPLLARDHVGSAVYYRWALRQLGALLDVLPAEEGILAARREMGFEAYARWLAQEANLEFLLLDEGYPPPDLAYPAAEMEEMLGVRVGRILRLEMLLQRLIGQHAGFGDVVESFDTILGEAADSGYVALKSIAAYRTGLQIEPVTDEEAEAAFGPARQEAAQSEPYRLTSKPLIDYFVLRAVRFAAGRSLPVQFHTGYGDPDLDLREVNPLHLRPLFEDASLAGAPIVLLHESYPYTAEAAYLAASYPNAYLDIAFCLPPLNRAELLRVLGIALGAAPASKLLTSSDGVGIPEHYWFGAVRARECVAGVLERMVETGELGKDDVRELGSMVLRDNALRVYRLP